MIVTIVKDILTNDAGVTAIVEDKVFPGMAPPKRLTDLPYIVYHFIDDTDPATNLLNTGGLSETRMQVDCWSSNYIEVHTLAKAVKQALLAVHGTYGDAIIQNVRNDGGSRGIYEDPTSGESKGIHGVSADYIFASRDA